MKAVELKQEILNYILDEVQTSVMRLGINAMLVYVTSKDYRGNEILKIESSKFQTMPVLFKELWLQGNVNTFDTDNKDIIGVAVSLDYHYSSFTGGNNGTELGVIRFYVDKDLPERIGENSARYYVNKVQGLEI